MSYGWEAWENPDWVLPGDPALEAGHDGARARVKAHELLNTRLLLTRARRDHSLHRAVLPAPRATNPSVLLEQSWPGGSGPTHLPATRGPSRLALRMRCDPTRGPDHSSGHSDWQRARSQEPCPEPP